MLFLKAFLSHATPDKPVAKRVADALSQRGLLPWLDEDRLEVGTDMLQRLPKAIREQGTFVLFISPRIRDRPWVEREIVAALAEEDQGRVKIFPVFMGDPMTLLKGHPLLAERWIIDEGGDVHVLGGCLPEALNNLEAAHVEKLADQLARAAYTLGGVRKAHELAIYTDQRGSGGRFGEPENLPQTLPESEMPCLVFRPDRQTRTAKETLDPKAWPGLRERMERSISMALGDRQGRIVHVLGRGQYAYPFALGRIFQRSTHTTLICHAGRRDEVFSNEGWGFIAPPRGWTRREQATDQLVAPAPGERCRTLALMVGQVERLPFVAAYLNASPEAPLRGLFIPCKLLENNEDVRSLVETIIATIDGVILDHHTRHVFLFTTLPFHSLPLLSASLDQVGVGVTLMEWMAGRDPANVADQDLYAPFQI